MLTLSRFRLRLERITPAHLELVRRGRNRDFVRQNHIYQKRITKEEQATWFEKINRPDTYYFVVSRHNRPIAATHMRGIDAGLTKGDYGLFVWDRRHHGTPVPVFITLLMLDFFFLDVGLELVEGVILEKNRAIRKICEFFHFSFRTAPEAGSLVTYSTRANYLSRRDFLMNFAEKSFRDKTELDLKVTGEKSTLHLNRINALLPAAGS
ncbi:MAG: GNAT family N-acetyltransferase [Spirochaetes bacterium]|nr:GNAT family N-acetyltransferase [Spirochaetota bacterium]